MSAETSVPKQREAGLGEFESWLPDAVLRDAPAGMAFFDAELRFVWVNPALARMYDRQVSDFSKQPVGAVWPAVDAARAEAALHQVLDQGSPATDTFETGAVGTGTALPSQRTFHWFGVTGTDGTLRGAGLIVIAGAAGPATEEALRRSEERYRALVQGGAQIVWVASPDDPARAPGAPLPRPGRHRPPARRRLPAARRSQPPGGRTSGPARG